MHWLLYNIPPEIRELTEGDRPEAERLASLKRACQGKNSWSRDNLELPGRRARRAGKPHHYHFKIHALDTVLGTAAGDRQADASESDGREHVDWSGRSDRSVRAKVEAASRRFRARWKPREPPRHLCGLESRQDAARCRVYF